jgi:hypothetical protein
MRSIAFMYWPDGGEAPVAPWIRRVAGHVGRLASPPYPPELAFQDWSIGALFFVLVNLFINKERNKSLLM